jgi:hypothetical protein
VESRVLTLVLDRNEGAACAALDERAVFNGVRVECDQGSNGVQHDVLLPQRTGGGSDEREGVRSAQLWRDPARAPVWCRHCCAVRRLGGWDELGWLVSRGRVVPSLPSTPPAGARPGPDVVDAPAQGRHGRMGVRRCNARTSGSAYECWVIHG